MQPGDVISHYEIVDQLGGGGMGVVYKARDTKLHRTVALKFLPPELSKNEEANTRFMQEAQAASGLDHPNICTVHDIRETEDGRLFIVMAYYEGQTLKYRLGNGPVSDDQAADIVRQVAEGLGAAHEAGIVHRDIKPANIMVTDKGRVKILDFGIAKLLGTTDLTQTGSSVGTPHYMSPEQIRGESVDHRTDLWSLGVVLHQMLTGKRPFEGDYEQAVNYAILNQDPDVLPEVVPEPLRHLCGKLLKKNPQERVENSSRVLAYLGVSHDVEQIEWARRRKRVPSKKQWLAFGVPTTLVMAALLLLAVLQLNRSGDDADVDAGPAISENTIAVMPFAVGGEELAYLDEGMVDLLSLGLEGAGDLHTVDPNTILGHLGADRSVVRNAELARGVATHFGAGRFVLGSLTQLGGQIRVKASLYDSDGALQQQAEATANDEAALPLAVDTLIVQLITGQVKEPLQEFASIATRTTRSIPALRAYLRGEYENRQGDIGAGREAFLAAVELDSTFVLALDRAMDWGVPDERFDALERQLVRHLARLPERERLLFKARTIFFDRCAIYASHVCEDVQHFSEKVAALREVTVRYPLFSRGWFILGDLLYHHASQNGMFTSDARPYLEQAVKLDPHNGEVLGHLVQLTAADQDFRSVDSLVATSPRDHPVETWLGIVWRNDREKIDSLFGLWNDAGAPGTWAPSVLALEAVKFLDDAPFALRVMETQVGKDPPGQGGKVLMVAIEAAQGRFRISDSVATSTLGPGLWASDLAANACLECPAHKEYLSGLHEGIEAFESIDPGNVNYDERREIMAFASALVYFKLDDRLGFQRNLDEVEQIARRKGSGSLAHSMAKVLHALRYWRAGNIPEALEAIGTDHAPDHFDHGPNSVLHGHDIERYLRGEFLYAEGRYEEALPWLAADGIWSLAFLGPSLLRRAQIYEQLGDTDEAMHFYRRFLKLWANADPELQPLVDEARERLDDLIKAELREPAQ